jgi:hypothetical protein
MITLMIKQALAARDGVFEDAVSRPLRQRPSSLGIKLTATRGGEP